MAATRRAICGASGPPRVEPAHLAARCRHRDLTPPTPCTRRTHCPEERCFAFDIHKHVFGECWLKHQAVDHTHAKDPHEGSKVYPPKMRFAPREIWPHAVREDVWSGPMPEYIPWTSGVLAPADAVVSSAPPDDQWKRRWCSKHGPCE